jgi:hypothetical protein
MFIHAMLTETLSCLIEDLRNQLGPDGPLDLKIDQAEMK